MSGLVPITWPAGTVSENWSSPCVTLKPRPSSVALAWSKLPFDTLGIATGARPLLTVRVTVDSGGTSVPPAGSTAITVPPATVSENSVFGAPSTNPAPRSSVLGVGLRLVHDVGHRDRRRSRRHDDLHRLPVGERAALGALADDRPRGIGRVLLFGDVDVESLRVRLRGRGLDGVADHARNLDLRAATDVGERDGGDRDHEDQRGGNEEGDERGASRASA